MLPFKLFFTGDYLDVRGAVRVGDIGLETLEVLEHPGFRAKLAHFAANQREQ
jgi:hypothetical protein